MGGHVSEIAGARGEGKESRRQGRALTRSARPFRHEVSAINSHKPTAQAARIADFMRAGAVIFEWRSRRRRDFAAGRLATSRSNACAAFETAFPRRLKLFVDRVGYFVRAILDCVLRGADSFLSLSLGFLGDPFRLKFFGTDSIADSLLDISDRCVCAARNLVC
jgi:hypothetical protein